MTTIAQWGYRAAALGVILLPWINTSVLAYAALSMALTDFTPVRSDELLYWHEIKTFRAAGFNGGYYTIQEQPAEAAFSHFYNHGPAFPALMGTISRFLPWTPSSMVFFNLLFVSLALALFIRLNQPTPRGLLALGLCILTFHPLWMYSTWTMQETLHQALGIALAALTYWILRDDTQSRFLSLSPRSCGRDGWGVRGLSGALLLVFIVALALLRVTWALALIPAVLILTRRRALPVRLAALIGSGLLTVALAALAQWWNAPFPLWFIVGLRAEFAVSVSAGLDALVDHIRLNLELFTQGNALWLAQRYQMVGLVLLFGFALTLNPSPCGKGTLPFALREKGQGMRAFFKRRLLGCLPVTSSEAYFHVLNLGLALAINIGIYDILDFRDYRVLAPHLLASLALLLAFRRWTPVLLIALINMLLIFTFVPTYIDQRQPESPLDQAMPLDARNLFVRQLVEEHLAYDPAALNPWCNTLLSDDFSAGLIAVPGGIGLSFTMWQPIDAPPHSKYIVLFHGDFDEARRAAFNLRELNRSAVGVLYRNLSADCP